MAPEYPPTLVIFDARFEGNTLKGKLQYVEPTQPGQLLRVRWAVNSKPAGFRAVGDGVAYVYGTRPRIAQITMSDDALPNDLGNSRYQWTEGMQYQIPWIMFVLILPPGYTLINPYPAPAGSKIHNQRIALYWLPKSNDIGRVIVECTIRALDNSLEEEIQRINREYLSLYNEMHIADRLEKEPHMRNYVGLIRDILTKRFSKSELIDLCQDTGIDYEEIPMVTKSDIARGIIAYHERRNNLAYLITVIAQNRPDILSDSGLKHLLVQL